MGLSKKTTILLSPRLYRMLKAISRSKNRSIGELIRSACEKQYGLFSESEALEAADRLSSLDLPVSTPASMKRESVAEPGELIP